MIKPLAFAVRPRWLTFAGRVMFACGLACAPVAAWADDGPSLGLVIPGLSVFLGDAPGYYAPPPPRSITRRPRRVTTWRRGPRESMAPDDGNVEDRRLGPDAGGMMMMTETLDAAVGCPA